MQRITGLGGLLLGAVVVSSGCVADDGAGEAREIEGPGASGATAPPVILPGGPGSLPVSVHGMCLSIDAIDPLAPRCTLADVPVFDAFASVDPTMQLFLHAALDGNATMQCKPTGDPTEPYCIAVVDRDPLGGTLEASDGMPGGRKNFFIAYADNAPGSPAQVFWDGQLGLAGPPPAPDFTLPPVELSRAGSLSNGVYRPATLPDWPVTRLMKFDPRDCGGCGLVYDGPGLSELTRSGLDAVAKGWWPSFEYSSSSACKVQRDPSPSITWATPTTYCDSELTYRYSGR